MRNKNLIGEVDYEVEQVPLEGTFRLSHPLSPPQKRASIQVVHRLSTDSGPSCPQLPCEQPGL